jgi:hypothetical protein
VPQTRRTLLRYGWNNLTPEEEVRVDPQILDVLRMQALEAQVLGGRATK